MAFTLYKKPQPLMERSVEPRVGISRNATNGTCITLNNRILDALKWIKGDRVEILVGTGEDAGYIAVRRAADGFKLCSNGSSSCLRVSSRGLLPGADVPSTKCNFTVEANTVVIAVPPAIREEQRKTSSIFQHINATVAA